MIQDIYPYAFMFYVLFQKSSFNLNVVNKLKHILMWPQGKFQTYLCLATYTCSVVNILNTFLELLFPVLDTTRLAIRDSNTNAELFSANDFGPILMKIIQDNLGPGML